MIDCGMCGNTFTKAEGAACRSGCPMSGKCGMVTCPSCGYEFPAESKIVGMVSSLANLVRRRLQPAARVKPVHESGDPNPWLHEVTP